MRNKQRIITRSKNYKATDINNLSGGIIEKSKLVSNYSLYGMGAGIGYALLTRKSVMFGIVIGALGGMAVGVMVDRYKNKNKENNNSNK